MDIHLTLYETRVLGSLIEKEKTTPDQYPLSLNALTNACNQKSNRDPVLEIEEETVQTIIDFVPTVVKDEADTIFLPGTAWRGLDAVEPLEQKLGTTVISVNQATIWLALRRIGWTEPIQGYGSLLRKMA